MLYLAFLPEALFSVGGSYLGGLYFWEASQETSLRQCAILVSNIHEVCQPVTVFFFCNLQSFAKEEHPLFG